MSKNKKPSEMKYYISDADLNAIVRNELRRHIKEDGWIKVDNVNEMVSEYVLQAVNAGVQEVFTALMEQHILGWSVIERDILPAVQKIDEEWVEKYTQSGFDPETAFDFLSLRMDVAINSTKRKLKKGGDA